MGNSQNLRLLEAVSKASTLLFEKQEGLPVNKLLLEAADIAEINELRHIWQEALENYCQFFIHTNDNINSAVFDLF